MLIIFKTVRKYLQATWEAVPSYRTILYHLEDEEEGDHGGFGEGAVGSGPRPGLGLGLGAGEAEAGTGVVGAEVNAAYHTNQLVNSFKVVTK